MLYTKNIHVFGRPFIPFSFVFNFCDSVFFFFLKINQIKKERDQFHEKKYFFNKSRTSITARGGRAVRGTRGIEIDPIMNDNNKKIRIYIKIGIHEHWLASPNM